MLLASATQLGLCGLAAIVAQTTGGPDLGNLWGLGVVAVALIVGQLMTMRYVVVPERTRAEKAELALAVRNALFEEKILPPFYALAQSHEQTGIALRELVVEVKRLVEVTNPRYPSPGGL